MYKRPLHTVVQCKEPRGHEIFHDDMIMYVIIYDKQNFRIRSTYSLYDQIHGHYTVHVFVHICMNSH